MDVALFPNARLDVLVVGEARLQTVPRVLGILGEEGLYLHEVQFWVPSREVALSPAAGDPGYAVVRAEAEADLAGEALEALAERLAGRVVATLLALRPGGGERNGSPEQHAQATAAG